MADALIRREEAVKVASRHEDAHAADGHFEAAYACVSIMRELAGITATDEVSAVRVLADSALPVSGDMVDIYSIPLSDLELSVRSAVALRRHGVETVGALCERTVNDLFGMKNMGKVNVQEVESKLSRLGLRLRTGSIGRLVEMSATNASTHSLAAEQVAAIRAALSEDVTVSILLMADGRVSMTLPRHVLNAARAAVGLEPL